MTTERSFRPPAFTFAAILVLAAVGWPPGSAAPRDDRTAAKFLNAPLSFEPNQGQAVSPVQFVSRGSGNALFLAPGRRPPTFRLAPPVARARRPIRHGRKPRPAGIPTRRARSAT